MAVKAGPRIIKEGLIFNIDPAVSRSYSGTGLTANGLVAGMGATLVNGTGFSSANNGSFFFDGTNDYLNVGNATTVQITSGTIAVWCKTSNAGGGYRGIVAKQYAYGFFYTDNVLTLYDWQIPRASSSGYNLADNRWQHVVFSFQSGVSNGSVLYLNGAGILTTTYSISSNAYNLFIGAEANASQFAACNIAQTLIYNRVLSAQEVLQLYNTTKKRYQ